MKYSRIKLVRTTQVPKTLLLLLMIAMLATPLRAEGSGEDESKVIRHVARLGDCGDFTVLGSGVGLLSQSPHGFLGVEASNLTPELRRHFGVADDVGVMLSRIVEDSAATAAGLRVGDIITRIDKEKITSSSRLGRVIRQQEGGATVAIEYWRDGSPYQATVTLEEKRRCAVDVGDYLQTLDLESLTDFDFGELDLSGIAISHEAIQDAMATVRDALESQDWEEHLEGLRAIDLEKIEQRMERVQQRLERLEGRLEREHGRDRERGEERQRDRERSENNRRETDAEGQPDTY